MLTAKTLDKYKRVIDEWFICEFNTIKAYKKIYPNVKKEETARVNFSKIKKIEEIQKYIEEKREESAKYLKTTHKGILGELKRWLEADLTEFIGLSKEEVKALPLSVRRLVIEHRITYKKNFFKSGEVKSEYQVIQFKFASKEKAIEMINKHIGFYEKDNEQKATDINISVKGSKSKEIVKNILEGNF